MPLFTHRLNVNADMRGVSREALIAAVQRAYNNGVASQRFNVGCIDAETRHWTSPMGALGSGWHIISQASVTRKDGAPVGAEDTVLIDSIAFGAMKSVAGRGWSVSEIRARLAPVGSDTARGRLFGEVTGVERDVSSVASCDAHARETPVAPGATVRAVSSVAPGTETPVAALVSQDTADTLRSYLPSSTAVTVVVAVVGVSVLAVGAAYVWRAFK